MKQPTYLKIGFYILMLFLGLQSFAQNFVDFTPKFNKTLQGDIRLIGNNILGPDNNAFNDKNTYNHNVNMRYIDIDGDGSTFNSSSADLEIPNAGCYQIVHAGLYWGAVNRGAKSESITDVKFKGPEGGYHDIKGEIIYDAQNTSTGNSYPYACYADVTSIVTGFSNNLGTYTVGNVSTGQGRTQNANNGTGHSAGWSLFIVFEDPTLPGKYITSFDGFSSVNQTNDVDVLISGFQTPPAPIPVTAKFAFAALEGDKPITGDKLKINGTTMFTADRPKNNFFNSTVTKLGGGLVTNRNPNSTNTLGFDTGIMDVPNPTKKVIGNGDTSAIIRMESSQDQYFAYFFAFAVDVIQPKIVLTKIVLDENNIDIGGQTVDLGQELNYIIGFQNKGNDDAQNMVIRDVLPINVHFNYPSGLIDLPPAVSNHTYDPGTRELVFTIDKTYLKKNESPLSEIRIRVKVVESCNELNDMCSNIIQNQAFTTYSGVENPTFEISDDPSVNSNTFCALIPQATNFLADLDDCIFRENATLCADSVVLTAANGYDKYSWSTDPSGSPVIGTDQSISVSTIGTYYVHNTAVAPCQSIDQIFEVTSFVGAVLNNPVIPFADVTAECPNNGRKLPKVFLCGANDSRLIDTKITDASSIIWEKLVEGSCTTTVGDDCANESESCSWVEVSRGPTFDANQSGQFRLTLNYQGGCFNQYYFNVYQNLLAPSASVEDIICNTPGKIIIGDVPTGYEYSINGVDYQEGNEFEVLVPGAYTASVRQIGVTSNPCIFPIPDIQVRKREFEVVSTITQPLCYDQKGNIYVEARDVRPQYEFILSENGNPVNTSGLVIDNFYSFSNLNPGNYTILVKTDDGCNYTETVEIKMPLLLEATSAITKPITCTDGEITIYPTGGTAPYFYFINGSTEFEIDPVIAVTSAGDYTILIVDSNDCETSTSITIESIPAPDYTLSKKDVFCYGSTGEIHFDVTNANGYTIGYSIDNGATYGPNATFSNLSIGTYSTSIKYSLNGIECFSENSEVIITQPDNGLTASAGVAELAGCDPSGNGYGKIRITNPQGGTPIYQYSFDNQDTWSTVNEAYVAPGTYTVYVKDANECIYAMPGVVLDPKPVDPVIDNEVSIDYNCDGTASGTITVNNPENATYSYTYFLNGVENTNTADPKTFLNVPVGEQTVSVKYKLESVPTYSNLLYETFGYGNDITSPGINTTYYCFERQTVGTECNGSISINDGDYSVTSRIVSPFSTWLNPVDHTPATNPVTPKGRYLAVNIGATIPTSAVLYEKEIHDIIPNQPIDFEFFAINLVKSFSNIYDPNLLIALVDASGTEISSFSTGDIPKSEQWEKYPKTPITLNPGDNTSLKFIVRSNVRQTNGNDVAIDDIRVYQLPKTCIDEKEFPIIINEGKEFGAHIVNASDASCSGVGNGSIQIAVANYNTATGFLYSIDNGVNWTTETTSPFTISNLDAGDYTIMVRYDNTDLCEVTLQQTLKIPEDLILDIDTTPVTCLDDSTIKVTATGGTEPYTFELVYPDTTTALFSNGTLTDIPEGNYTVNLTDANGCTTTSDVFTIDAVDIPTATLEITNACYVSGTNTSIEVTAAGGLPPYQYSINGTAFDGNNSFNNLTPGDYDIAVRDVNGCVVNLPTQTIAPQLILNAEITSELDCTGSPEAEITLTATGGTGTYSTYEVSTDGINYTSLPGATYTTASAGTFYFKVTDSENCIAFSDVVNIAAKIDISATELATDVSCFGGSDGTITVTATGGAGSYEYSIDDGVLYQTSNQFKGLSAATYTITVKDALDCTTTVEGTIDGPAVVAGTIDLTQGLTCDVDNNTQSALVTVTGTGGTGTYTYSFNGAAYTTDNTYSTSVAGSVKAFIKDANGCTSPVELEITIPVLDSPTDLDFNASTITCDVTESTVTLTPTPTVGVYTYEILSPTSATTNITGATSGVFTGLIAGTYNFQVTDENGCFYTETFEIAPVTTIALTGNATNDVSCFGANDGTAEFSVSGFSGSYSYAVNDVPTATGQTSNTISLTSLAFGSYKVEVTDETTGCTAEYTISIEEPTVLSLAVDTNINAHCNADAQVAVTASGGTPNYTYAFVPTGTAPLPTDYSGTRSASLDPAISLNWTIWVLDSKECEASLDINITTEPLPTATLLTTNTCYVSGTNTSIEVNASGGLAPYQYSINGSAFGADYIFNNLTPGDYDIVVRDANGCPVALSTHTIAPQLDLKTEITSELDCTPSSTATITGTVSGGYGANTYEVSINGAAYTTEVGNPFPYAATTAGTYQFRVTDVEGCTATSEVMTVDAIELPTATTTVVNATCNSNNDGSVQIIPSGGVGPYMFSFDGGTFTTTSLYSGLLAGTYAYQVRDAKSCIFDGSVTINEPTDLVVSASATTLFSCATDNTPQSAEVTIAVPTTGTAPYTYSFNGSGYTATNTYSVNDNGSSQTITYSVRDAHGCIAGDSVIIDPLNAPTDLDFTASTITCDATTSTVTLTSTNGVAPLEYETLATSPIVFAKQTSNTFAGLTPGTYVFRVTDANGCYYTESVTISPVTNIAVTGLKLSDVLCYGDTTGAIKFTVSGYSAAYTYALTSGTGTITQTGNTINLTDLVAGTYILEVTDTDTGCTAIETITIEEPTAPLGITATATNIHCNNYESQITTTVTGGTPNYKYAAVVAGSSAPADSDYDANPIITVNTNTGADLFWDVYVKDLNDCIETTTVTIAEEALPTVTAPAVDNQCDVSSGFTFTATGTGVAPLSYSINGGASYQDHGTFTVNAAGSYTITVKDGNGCTATSPTATEVFAPITVGASLTQDISCFVTPEASIDITVSGGNAPYSYEVSLDGGPYSPILGSPYTTSIAGTYQFKVTDANGCEKLPPEVIVTPKVDPEITAVAIGQNISCNGEETGSLNITIDTSKGLAPFVINVLNTTTGTDYGTQTSGLAAGDYTITVTDAKGCTDTDTITILEPDPIVLDFDVEPITCGVGGISLGRIIINSVTGGTPNYTYHVKGVNGYDEQRTNQTGSVQFFEVVDFGLYEVIITDANGCMFLQQDILVASPPEDLDIDIVTTVDCITGGAADVSIGASSTTTGTGPFYFAVYDGAGMIWDAISGGSPTWQLGTGTPAGTSFTNLTPGVIYTFIVYDDDTKCYYYETAASPIPTSSTLTADAVTADNITCVGSADGDVSFTINSVYGSDTDVSYEIFDSQSLVSTGVTGTGTVPANGSLTIEDLGPLPFGNYYVLISETSGPNAGCSVVTVPFNITESAFDLSITASVSKNENCKALGVITAIAKDGTAPYEYQITTSAVEPLASDPLWTSVNTFNEIEGSYYVYVKDAYGCIKQAPITLTKDEEPTIDTVSPHCFDGTPFTITLSGNTFNGNMTYSIGGQYQTSPDFTISEARSYTISIKDDNDCIATETFIVQPPILLDADLDLDLTCDVDASIILNPTGGTGTYVTYEVSSDGGVTYMPILDPTFHTNTDGVYTFRVTDDQGCQAVSNDVVVTPNTTPKFTTTQTNVSCNGGADGSIIVTAANGIAPYEYSIDGGTFQTSNVFKNLAAGTYSIVVRDSKNCESVPDVITITEPPLVGGSLDPTQSLTCGVENATQAATVTVTGSGGTAPYTYSFDGINYTTTNTYKTFEAGTVTAYVKDANGCPIDAPIQIVIDALSVPTDLGFVATPVTCIATTSTVTLTATDGIGTLNYEIISPSVVAPQTSNIFTGLAPDTYVFKVTDANGCYYTESYTIDPVTNITVSGSLVNDVSCSGGTDGAVRFEVANFSGTFSYQVNGGTVISGQTDTDKIISVSGLAVGDQTIVVTDEVTGCTATFTVPVSEPTPVALVETININAHCNFGAQVTVEASGGTAPYQYAFVLDGSAPVLTDYTNSATAVLNPAISANWDVLVMDANGCTDTIDVVIDTDPLPSVTVPTFAINQCIVTSGFEFTVTDPVGIAPFTYSIGHGFTSDPTFTVATPGTYTVTVKDGNGCTNAVPVSIEIYPALNPTVSITQLASCDDNDGEIEVKGSGGSGTYSYAISPTSASITQTGGVFTGLAHSTLYTITVTDDVTGCDETIETTLEAPTPVTFDLNATHVSCNGKSDGEITVSLEPGNDNPIYSYAIVAATPSGAPTRPAQGSNIFKGLPAGFYTIEVRSGRNCVDTKVIEVTEPSILETTASATTLFSCSITNEKQVAIITVVEPITGTAPYKYSFNGGGFTSTLTYSVQDNGAAQTITYSVRDANGCEFTNSVSLDPLDPPTVVSITATTITCIDEESVVTVTAANGVGNVTYEILSPASAIGNATGANTGIFTGLAPGTYDFKVTDENGCYDTESVKIDPVTNIAITGNPTSDVNCFEGSDGTAEFIVSGFAGTYTSALMSGTGNISQSGNTVSLSGLIAGSYTVQVTDDTTGCVADYEVTINQPTEVLALTADATNVFCSEYESQITVTAIGGTLNYTYAAVVAGQPEPTVFGNSAVMVVDTNMGANLVWDVYVKDANGCTEDTQVTILEDPLPDASVPIFAANQCDVTNAYTFEVTSATGVGPFKYSIGNGFQDSPIFTVTTPGNYEITIQDANLCEVILPTDITIYPALNPSVSITQLASCDDNDGEIEVKGSGGSDSTYSYAISPTSGFITQTGGVFTGLAYSTLYTITVTDDVTGCTANVETTLEAPTPVTFTASATDVSCNGGSDGEITVTLEPGNDNPIYSYEITVGPETKAAQDSNIFTGLPAGIYTVEVRSGRNCVATEVVEVKQPDLVVITGLDVKPYSCITDTNTTNYATITVTSVTGGSGNFTFYEFYRDAVLVQSGNKNTYTETDLAGGNYVIHVYDDKVCSASTTTTIAPIVILETLEIDIVDAITCTNDESIQVVVNRGGVLPTNLEYTLTKEAYTETNATGTFTGLTVGNYIITVMNMDTGCLEKTVHYVNAPNTFDLTIDNVVDVTCFSDSDGSAEVTFIDRLANPTSKAGPFSYEVFNVNDLVTAVHTGATTNEGPVTIPNLAAGTYTVNATLINTPFCTVSKNFTITAPTAALNVTTTHTEITCVSGNNDGTISAKATGGWPGGYEYQLELVSGGIQVPFSTNANFTNLTAGDYNVRVKDSRGCEALAPVSLVIPPPITVTVSATPTLLLCFGDTNATLTANASGGQGSNYLYTLNRVTGTPTTSGPQTSSTFTGLGAGTYSITVTDGYNCTETSAEVVITEPAKVEANLIKSISQTCLTDTELTLSATGGTGTYEYSADANFTTVSPPFTSSTTISIPQGVSGIYQYYVRDTNGCSAYVSNQIKIDPFIPLTVNLTAITSHINCYGDTNGSFIATAQGGLGNYVYTLQDASGNDISPTPVQTRPGVFTELSAGTYTVFVESGDCDATSAQITITEPALPFEATFNTTNVVCFGETDGELDIIATGGTGTIKYAISPQLNQFFETSKFENLAPGTYQAIAQDELGCFILHDFVITEPIPVILTLIPGSELPEICEGDLDGEFSVEISGGTLPYSVSLDNVDGPYIPGAPTQTQFDFTGLAGGNHTVFVRDALDCETEWEIEFPESVLIVPEVEVAFDCTDNLLSNSVTVTVVDNGIDPSELDYSLNGAPYQTSNIFIDVPSGSNHYIDVRHTNGCVVRTALFDVDQYDPLELVLEDGGLNEIVTVTTGGAAPFEYSLNGVSYGDTSTFIIYKSGDYTVTVTDSNGCTATVTKYFEFIDVCIPNYFVPENGGWGPGCTSQYKNMTFDIFDRYGRKIATLRLGDKWDGTYNGKELPTGDYWYVVKLNDKNYDREFVGHFTLYR